jgi:hypothetical protein
LQVKERAGGHMRKNRFLKERPWWVIWPEHGDRCCFCLTSASFLDCPLPVPPALDSLPLKLLLRSTYGSVVNSCVVKCIFMLTASSQFDFQFFNGRACIGLTMLPVFTNALNQCSSATVF